MQRKIKAMLVATGAAVTIAVSGTPANAIPISFVAYVDEGVERGCLVLRPLQSPSSLVYQPIGEKAKELKVGSTVRVTGELVNINTWCQQGRPLEILRVSPV